MTTLDPQAISYFRMLLGSDLLGFASMEHTEQNPDTLVALKVDTTAWFQKDGQYKGLRLRGIDHEDQNGDIYYDYTMNLYPALEFPLSNDDLKLKSFIVRSVEVWGRRPPQSTIEEFRAIGFSISPDHTNDWFRIKAVDGKTLSWLFFPTSPSMEIYANAKWENLFITNHAQEYSKLLEIT